MKKIIIANWKCNPETLKEAQKMFLGLKAGVKNNKAEVVVCPPFVYLTLAKKILGVHSHTKQSYGVGAQNCFWENSGAYTGEISPKMLKDLGVKYVILGHSERVMVMGETNEMIAKKVKASLSAGLIPVVCIGETIEERNQSKTFQVIEKEIKECLKNIKKQQVEKIVVAYEPLWAIGSGNNCLPDDALTMALYIKKLVCEIYGRKAKENIKVLYGGSVGIDNANKYLENEANDGLLVGNVSLNIKEFLSIIHTI